jgi:hypothetical protein
VVDTKIMRERCKETIEYPGPASDRGSSVEFDRVLVYVPLENLHRMRSCQSRLQDALQSIRSSGLLHQSS